MPKAYSSNMQSQVATKGQQQQTRQQARLPFQAGRSRPLTFTLPLTKHFNPPSVSSAAGAKSQHNKSELSSFFENVQSMMSYQQIYTQQLFPPANMSVSAASPLTTARQHEHQQPPAQSQPALQSANTKQQQQWNNCHCLQSVFFRATAVNNLKVVFRTNQKQLIALCSENIPKQEALHCPRKNTLPHKHKKKLG